MPKRKSRALTTQETPYPYPSSSVAQAQSYHDATYLTSDHNPKRARYDTNSNTDQAPVEVEEKRLARVKKSCPQNISERVYRVMTQRFFMVDRQRNDGELREEFKVLGSTGNVYTVTIDRLPSCNCPDAQKGNHCKHILFIFLKVLGVSQNSSYYYQKALLTSELREIFDSARPNPSAVASARILDLYSEATGKSVGKGKEANKPKETPKKQLEDGDECPICYEALKDAGDANLVFCAVCTNAIHKECFGQWRATNRGKEITCVWCRSVWADEEEAEGSSKGKGKGTVGYDEGYLNLGRASGLSPVRDTSTYYNGPMRGYKYRKYY